MEELAQALESKQLTQPQLKKFISEGQESLGLLDNNLQRASELISSFKQVAVDQASDAIRDINLKRYVEDLIQSLQPQLKKTQHQIHIECPADLYIRCPAGAISQIFTNLIMNSLLHGFDGINSGNMWINITTEHDGEQDLLRIRYSDDGIGIDEQKLNHLFDPFFTTKRDQGGSGLGTHIVRNLVTQTLKGDINAYSEPGNGLTYEFTFPVIILN